MQDSGANQDAEQFGFAEAQLAPRDLDNAGTSRPYHLDAGASAKTQLFQAMNLFRLADNLANFRTLAGEQLVEGN
jgi:hypothetical protein